MLTVVMSSKSVQDAMQELARLHADIKAVEWRLDYLQVWDAEAIAEVAAKASLPLVMTLRRSVQGGFYDGTAEEWLECLHSVLHYDSSCIVDVDVSLPRGYLSQIRAAYPHVKLIHSYHNFDETPKSLQSIYNQMQHPAVDIIKISTMATSSLDAMRVLCFLQVHVGKHELIMHCMGETGTFSRVLGAALGNALTYISLSNESTVAPGILSAKVATDIYHVQNLNKQTNFFALIGNPVSASIGYRYHNEQIHKMQRNAVYVSIQLEESELDEFFVYAKQLPFVGLSVTMPYKQKVMSYLRDATPELKKLNACNTIRFSAKGLEGCNTDGEGAMQAIYQACPGVNRQMLLLGCGGAARSILAAATQENFDVVIANRDEDKAKKYAEQYQQQAIRLSDVDCLDVSYTVIVATLPTAAYTSELLAKLANLCRQASLVMDIAVSHNDTPLVKLAASLGVKAIDAAPMFYAQADLQIAFWS